MGWNGFWIVWLKGSIAYGVGFGEGFGAHGEDDVVKTLEI